MTARPLFVLAATLPSLFHRVVPGMTFEPAAFQLLASIAVDGFGSSKHYGCPHATPAGTLPLPATILSVNRDGMF